MERYRIAVSTMALNGKIPQGSPLWSKFNASFENMELDLWEFAHAVYMGHPFTTWHKNRWRDNRNYLLGQHIGLDFDSGDERSSIDYLSRDPFVDKFASLIYTTPSHTENAPKARVVFLLDQPIRQAQNYALAAAALLWIFGTADRQCKDPARFFYGSKDCDLKLNENVLPVSVVKDLVLEYRTTGRTAKNKTSKPFSTKDPDILEIQRALDCIPAMEIDYGEWVTVLMALHHDLPENIGLPLAEAWGMGQGDEIARKWKSFARTEGEKVGLGTVFHLAKRFGYNRPIG